MIVSKLVKIATEEFEQKMGEIGQNWDARKLTAELAEQFRVDLLESFSRACRKAYKSFLEHYDPQEYLIEWQG